MSTSVLAKFLKAQDRLVLQASDLSLGTIANMVSRSAIDIDPSYQRRERWDNQKKSALIESFLLNVPVPPVYLAEDEFGKYSVVDGKQRITAIHSFLTNELALSKLESFNEVEGLYFKDLPKEMQNALEVRPYMRVITILKQSDPTLKFEVFTRLNKGGESMQPQELRKVAFRGNLNDSIYKLAENTFLKQQLKIKDDKSAGYKLMTDAETVLRFFMLRERWRTFSGDFRVGMDLFMAKNQHANKQTVNSLEMGFKRAIEACEQIWGDNAFKRPYANIWRDQFISGMYDAEMIAVDGLTDAELLRAIKNATKITTDTKLLFDDIAFDEAVRQATNQNRRIKYRVERIVEVLKVK
ncbi:DUF262 domain-containing protein [Hymenobacter terrenus]|uniref:DUF262 domain-containing protein n=1 Tax=Hymenobacter terrenus TaxID=1629124 RepID=UPI0006198B73|nr:DUF262 domain-containing protein [Hymenobacter terrenus]